MSYLGEGTEWAMEGSLSDADNEGDLLQVAGGEPEWGQPHMSRPSTTRSTRAGGTFHLHTSVKLFQNKAPSCPSEVFP